MTLVAISGAYGAGGSRIARALAERLGVPFVDRAITAAVAEQLAVPFEAAAAHDEQSGGSWLERVLRGFIGGDAGVPTPLPADVSSAEDFRIATEEVLRQQAATGEGVILGRGGVLVFRDDPRVLRVRLGGPQERRLAQAMKIEGIDRATAERRLRRLDRTHAAYARDFYGVELRDTSLYHVVLDSTAIEIETCVEIIAAAAAALRGVPAARST